MEEKESKHIALQTDSLSLLIKTEEGEATPQRGHLGDHTAGKEVLTNGLSAHNSHEGLVTPVCSPGTSYWSVSESPDSPFLLSPVPGPSMQNTSPVKPQQASRASHSRIPGRDHRRYYHAYWRSEYLMDYDPFRHGMICMVCGSSLATLKLSTIKRHIRQKHPHSLLWSASDKEVIRFGWESHLNMVNSQRPLDSDPNIAPISEEMKDGDGNFTGKPGGAVTPKHQSESDFSKVTPSPPDTSIQELPNPTAQLLERYLNDSLHAWFRQEFLMEYQAEAGRLVCMVCCCLLPSLHLDTIKSHVLNLHPNSLLYGAEEKHSILKTWAKIHESDPLQDFKSELDVQEVSIDGSTPFFPMDTDPIRGNSGSYTRVNEVPPDTGQKRQHLPHRFPRKRRLRDGSPWRLRLDYLVAYGPPSNPGCFCMVCSEHLPVSRVSRFRKHIQECHPETSCLSRKEREDLANSWVKEENIDSATPKEGLHSATVPVNTVIDVQTSPVKITQQRGIKTEDVKAEDNQITPIKSSTPTPGRHGHYPGKDQRRNYQVRWRMEFLMEYDSRRHGLICMVCGATLATLKVSTIKRHIQQVHPYSLDYSPEQRQQALFSHVQTTLQFVNSDDCFSGSDHSHSMNANADVNGNADVNINAGQTVSQST